MAATVDVRLAQGRLLLPLSARTIRWGSFLVIAALAALVVWTGARKGGNPAAVALPVATSLLGVWLCFLFDDAAAETTAGGPTPLLFRRAIRAAVAIPAVTVAWFACTWIGPLTGPSGPMMAAFAVCVTIALAAAAMSARLVASGAGLLAAAAVVTITLILPVAFGRPPSVDPARPPWGEPAGYWGALGLLAIVTLLMAHVDPAGLRPTAHR